jgi:hypothetical protein
MSEYPVSVARDFDEGVRSVGASDMPGMNAEAPAYEDLVVLDLAPDLVEATLGGRPRIP